MFGSDGVRIKKSSSDIFTDFKILDFDRTPQGFGEKHDRLFPHLPFSSIRDNSNQKRKNYHL